jgi:hypothetical protein
MVPDQVSVPVTVPCVVSFTAEAAGTLTITIRSDIMYSITRDTDFVRFSLDIRNSPVMSMNAMNIILRLIWQQENIIIRKEYHYFPRKSAENCRNKVKKMI